MGTDYYRKRKFTHENPFWKDVFIAWHKLSVALKIDSKYSILSQPLWHNSIISDYPIFFPLWYNAGITFLRDIVNANTGDLLTANELSLLYNININFLDYHRVTANVKRFLKEHLEQYHNLKFEPSPIIPSHIQIFFKHHKGAKDMYNTLNNKEVKVTGLSKWENELNLTLSQTEQKSLLRTCFNTSKDHCKIWLQYKIITRILGTREYTNKLRITPSNLCRLCNNAPESISHLFYQCNRSIVLWRELKHCVLQNTGISLPIRIDFIVLGYYITEPNSIPINFIFINTKHFIFTCAHHQKTLFFPNLKRKLQQAYLEHKMAAKLNFTLDKFNKDWNQWSLFFNDPQ